MPARKISEILHADAALGKISAGSHRVEQLQRIYLEAVPAALARASRVGWSRADVVSIVASNGAAAAKLRQMTPRILDGFKRHGLQFNSMRIEVQVEPGAPVRAAPRAKKLPDAAVQTIEQTLATLPPSPLRAALARLARRR